MAFTTIQLEKLEEAIANGSLTVKYQDKQITYRSIDEMLRVRDMMRRELGIAASQYSRIFSEFNKGL